jgi:type IV secretory pathway protease TraF
LAPARVGPDEVFLLGDDPVVASDSRQWGPVKQANVEGVARRILWSAAPHDGAPEWGRVGQRVR